MIHALAALLILLAAPQAALAQDLPGSEASQSEAGLAGDPVAMWQAEPTGVLSAEGVDLAAFRYLARPLVVFGDSPLQPQVVEQLRLIEREIGDLAGRDVAVIVDTDPSARSAVRQALRPRGFALVLLDKDGRVTLRRPAPLSVREIARAIDRTPLRREELRNGAGDEPIN
ncbi:hypothetical protein Rumeso_00113 [Rubellimicrobium mesophilum DSM 19309]|uniref:DUF4174 domain-containing protein n=1 Tax=Rubellimicrobium mesophilum DSM 19309 TaxID=442562 RepID=A0A017HX04_9RHOB|nr:DUF4174 domain-containing protein [Rubellimicrobium mesophilum]EYD78284.1 hypothetical protein Rumeso_00113 [Rubellimicrobium mesophilum DSM 19309]